LHLFVVVVVVVVDGGSLCIDCSAPADGMAVAGESQFWNPLRTSGSFAGGGEQAQQLAPLFLSRSFTNITELKAEQTSAFGLPNVSRQDRSEVLASREKIKAISEFDIQQEQQLETMKQLQHRLSLNLSKESVAQLQLQQAQMFQQIDVELKELADLTRGTILEPLELNQARVLVSRLSIQQQKLDLYRRELHHIATNPGSPQWYACHSEEPPLSCA
jgi:hypothetical protein